MRTLSDLLSTWEIWSARATLTRALEGANTDETRDSLRRGLADTPAVDPLDALHDATELVTLLCGWQWQAMYAARVAGSSWEQVGTAVGIPADAARTNFREALDRQDLVRPGSTERYRAVLR